MKPIYKLAILLVTVAFAIAVIRIVLSSSAKPATTTDTTSAALATNASESKEPFSLNISTWHCYNLNGAKANSRKLSDSESGLPAGTEAFRIQVDQVGKQVYDIGYEYHFHKYDFTPGETVVLHFKARSKSAALMAAQMQLAQPPQYLPCWTKFIRLTPDWKDYAFTIVARDAPAESLVSFKLGNSIGTTDFADITLQRK